MKIFRAIMRTISITLLLSTAICGTYVQANKATLTDYNGSVQFHLVIGILAIIFCIITMFLPGNKVKEGSDLHDKSTKI